MLLCFLAQFIVLGMRGDMRGTCPLGDSGEILVFTAWSITMCYLVVGSVFRLSLLGVFAAPLVCLLLSLALIPGMLENNPVRVVQSDPWRAAHAGFSVLAYGALGLAAVSAVMFLVLDRQLKDGVFTRGLFRNLPPARELGLVVKRLLWLGLSILTFGVVSGVIMESPHGAGKHLVAAAAMWVAYLILLIVMGWRGMPPKRFATITVFLFVFSLLIFVLL